MQLLKQRRLILIVVLVLLGLLLWGMLLSSAADTTRAPPEPRELPGLREVPEIPVESIPLRHDLPDHPHGPPSETEEPSNMNGSP